MGVPQNGSKWLLNSENCINQWDLRGHNSRCQAGRSAPSRPVINCGLIFWWLLYRIYYVTASKRICQKFIEISLILG